MISPLGFIEYDAPDGSRWRVEDGLGLLGFFAIEGSEAEQTEAVTKLHGTLEGAPKILDVVTRRFGAAPMFGTEDVELFKPWEVKEIAARRGLEVADVETRLKSAAEIWRKTQRAAQAAALSTKPEDHERELTVLEAKKLMARYGFHTKKVSDEEALYVGGRVQNLEEYLESEHQRALARSMIQSEAILFFSVEPSMRALQERMNEQQAKDGVTRETEDRMSKILSTRNATQQQIQDIMKQLGINESQSSSMKRGREFRECLSLVVEAVREYEADGSHELIDGVFTAAEVKILTTPFVGRDAQYRPDLILMMPQYLQGVYDRDFEERGLPGRQHRKLIEGFKIGLGMARGEIGESVEEIDPESTEDAREELLHEAETSERNATGTGGQEAAMRNAAAPPPVQPRTKPQRLSDF